MSDDEHVLKDTLTSGRDSGSVSDMAKRGLRYDELGEERGEEGRRKDSPGSSVQLARRPVPTHQ